MQPLIIHDPLGHTKVVEADTLDVFTQQGWRLVAVLQDSDVVETLEPMSTEELRSVYGDQGAHGIPQQGYNARPHNGLLYVQRGLKAVGRVRVRTWFLIAKHVDASIVDLASRNEQLQASLDEERAARATADRLFQEAQEWRTGQSALLKRTDLERIDAEHTAAKLRNDLRLAEERVQRYEQNLAKLRRALGDVQIDGILKGTPAS